MQEPPKIWMTAGIVEGTTSPTPPPPFGPASSYGYKVTIYLPNGQSMQFDDVQPSLERYDDTTNVRPIKPNTIVPVAMVTDFNGQQCFILAREILHVVPCGGSPIVGGPSDESELRIRFGVQPSFQGVSGGGSDQP